MADVDAHLLLSDDFTVTCEHPLFANDKPVMVHVVTPDATVVPPTLIPSTNNPISVVAGVVEFPQVPETTVVVVVIEVEMVGTVEVPLAVYIHDCT